MPTKAGRLRIEDLRKGQIVWDLAIDWEACSVYPRPLKIVALFPVMRSGRQEHMIGLKEPEGYYLSLHTRKALTRCGFYSKGDESRSDGAIVREGVSASSLFINRKAVARYAERMGLAYNQPGYDASRESAPHLPKGQRLTIPEQMLSDEIEKSLRREFWFSENALRKLDKGYIEISIPRHLRDLVTEQRVHDSINTYLESVKPCPIPSIEIRSSVVNPDGSVTLTLQGRPDIIERLAKEG